MKVMSEGIQKSAGEKFKTALNFMTINRFTAVFTGFLVTGIIQSSSATTVMVVGLVNAGLFTLTQAIGVIMGANIGTTVTGWIVALIGFKMNVAAFALPAVAVSIPFLFVSKWGKQHFGEALLGFGLLFLGLSLIKDFVPNLQKNTEALVFLARYTDLGFISFIIFVAAGTLITILIQSSSAAMAITLTMAYSGWINFPTAACLVLGENIGTTITAYLASLSGNVNARRASRAHTLFNVFGVIWMAAIFSPFLGFVKTIVPDVAGDMSRIAAQLAFFHTLFNLTNTALFIGFVKPFAKLVTFLVKSRPGEDNLRYKLIYQDIGIRPSPEINILKAELEIKKMAQIKEEMFQLAINSLLFPPKRVPVLVESIRNRERLLDLMHEEITQFLIQCSRENLPQKSLEKINQLIRITNEIESISDCCGKLANCAETKMRRNIDFDKQGIEQITSYVEQVKKFLDFNLRHLGEKLSAGDMEEASGFEDSIDRSRDSLKKSAQKRLKSGTSNIKSEMLYIDALRHIEHVGDHSFEISRALYRMRTGPASSALSREARGSAV
jgi:phosphate:Na+ symporter